MKNKKSLGKKFIYTGHTYILLAYFLFSYVLGSLKYQVHFSIEQLLTWTLIPILASLGVTILAMSRSANKIKTSLILTLIFNLVFYFPTWTGLIYEIPFFQEFVQLLNLYPKIVSLFLTSGITVLLLCYLRKTTANLKPVGSYMTTLLTCLSIYTLFSTIVLTKKTSIRLENTFDSARLQPVVYSPDIIYIITDCYTSSGSLKKYFGFNNGAFTQHLRKKGFYIAENSRSNYNFTSSSLASSLNSSYLNIREKALLNAVNRQTLVSLINRSHVVSFLFSQHYKLSFSGVYPIFSYKPTEDFSAALPDPPPTLYSSLFLSLYKRFGSPYHKANESFYTAVMKSLSFMDQVPASIKVPHEPRFIFVHTQATHPPYVIDSHGNFETDLKKAYDRSSYLVEVNYLNKRLISFIDSTLSGSGKKPVIIIQGDHGSHLVNLEETSTILNAYYFPDGDYSSLYPAISPVNTFRVVMNKYFKTRLPLLPDKSYHIF